MVLGTRGSELALAQTRMVEEALARTRPLVKVATEIIRTRGDHEHVAPSELDRTKGRKGIFTAELERALMEKRIDVAVHSAKDLSSEMDNALTITAVLPRGAVEDLLLRKSTAHAPLATIATGSVRRQRQTRWSNPAARVVGLRGNVSLFASGAGVSAVIARRLRFAGGRARSIYEERNGIARPTVWRCTGAKNGERARKRSGETGGRSF